MSKKIFCMFVSLLLLSSVGFGENGIKWVDAKTLTIEGRGWNEPSNFYNRLPASAEKAVTSPVWRLSHDSAGIVVRFSSDASKIFVKWKLRSKKLAFERMPSSSVSGIDLYVRHNDEWRWLANGVPDNYPVSQALLAEDIPEGWKDYLMYLPLYNGVHSVEIGIPKKTSIKPFPRLPASRPIVVYGSSIAQGSAASRPGTAYVAILGRLLDSPIINLGFSGTATMEASIVDLLAQIDAKLFFIDAMPNMTATEVYQASGNLVRTLRKKHPKTPIVLVEDRFYQDGFLQKTRLEKNLNNHRELKRSFADLQKAGISNLHYIDAENQLGIDGEGTVDGSHPNDLGFDRMAKHFASSLKEIVAKNH